MQITLENILKTRTLLSPYVFNTPVWQWRTGVAKELFADTTDVFLKLEMLQVSGSFKNRGAMSVLLNAEEMSLKSGVTALSAENHAIAVSYASKLLGMSAKVVMPKLANKARVEKCETLGADVVLANDVYDALDMVAQIAKDNLEEIVLVDDNALRSAMRLLSHDLKLAVEPAAAAAIAALSGPLRDKLNGLKVGVIVCGTNIDAESFYKHISE